MAPTQRQVTLMIKARDAASRTFRRVGTSIKSIGAAAATASRGIALMQAKVTGLIASLTALQTRLGSLGLGLTAAFIGFAAVRDIASFGDKLSVVGAVSSATADQMERMTKMAMDLGRDTRFTATEAAAGMEFLARATGDAEFSMATLPSSLNLAAAGMLDLGTAADIQTNVMAQFSLEASQASHVADVLAHTANSSNTNVMEMAEALKFAGGTAGLMGASLEETAAAIAVLAQQGRKASVAGAGLNTMMIKLGTPSNKLTRMLSRLGLTYADIDMQVHGLVGTLRNLRDAGIRTEEANDIFGTRAGPTFNALMKMIDDMGERAEENLNQIDGTSARVATEMEDNLGGALRRLRSAWANLFLSWDQQKDGWLRSLVEGLQIFLRAFTATRDELVQGMRDIPKFDVFSDEQLKQFANAAKAAAAGVKVLITALGGALAIGLSLKALAAVFAFISAPVTAVIAAVAALAATYHLLKDTMFETSRGAISGSFLMQATYDVLVDKVSWAFSAIAGFYREHETTIKTFVENAAKFFVWLIQSQVKAFGGAIDVMGMIVKGQLTLIQGFVNTILRMYNQLMRGIGNHEGQIALQTFADDFPSSLTENIISAVNGFREEVVTRAEQLSRQDVLRRRRGGQSPRSERGTSGTIPTGAPVVDDGFVPSMDLGGGMSAAERALKRFNDTLKDTIDAWEMEAAAVGESQRTQQLWAAAKQLGIRLWREETLTRRQANAVAQLEEALDVRLAAQAQQRLVDIQRETQLIRDKMALEGLDARARAIAIAELEARNEAIRDGITLTYEYIEAVRERAAADYDANNRTLTVVEGLKRGWEEWSQAAGNAGEQVRGVTVNFLDGLTNNFAAFFAGQKVNWRQFALSTIQEINKIIVRMLFMKAISSFGIFGGGGSFGSGGGVLDAGTAIGGSTAFAKKGATFFANGGTFTNKIFRRTTPFKFSRGGAPALGVMGEAGPEAVMPLKRGRNGSLGVQVTGGSNGATVIDYNPSFQITLEGSGADGGGGQDPAAIKQMLENMDATMRAYVLDILNKERLPGGALYKGAT